MPRERIITDDYYETTKIVWDEEKFALVVEKKTGLKRYSTHSHIFSTWEMLDIVRFASEVGLGTK